MNNLTIIDHPLIKRDVAILRDATASNHLFRTTLRRISSIMAFTVTHDLRLRKTKVQTPLELTTGHVLADDIVIVPVLRAGLGLIDGFLDVLPEARVGHVGLYRNEKTLEPVDYYSKFPQGLGKSLVITSRPDACDRGECVGGDHLPETPGCTPDPLCCAGGGTRRRAACGGEPSRCPDVRRGARPQAQLFRATSFPVSATRATGCSVRSDPAAGGLPGPAGRSWHSLIFLDSRTWQPIFL